MSLNPTKISLFLGIFLLGLKPIGMGQDLNRYIPKDAFAVMSVNAQRYSEKVDMDKVLELEVFQSLDQQAQKKMGDKYAVISNIYKQPKEAGIDLFPKSYGYAELVDSLYMMSYVFKIADKAKFEDFLGQTIVPVSSEKKILKGKGYHYVTQTSKGAMMVAWTDEAASFIFADGESKGIRKGLSYDDPDYYDKLEERKKAFNQTKLKAIMGKAKRVKGIKGTGIASNPNYQQFDKSPFDVGVWVDAEGFSELIRRNAASEFSSPQKKNMAGVLSSMNEGYYYHIGMNFESGALDLRSRTFVPADKFSDFAEMYQKRPNKEFFSYVNGNNIIGLGSVAIDIKKTAANILETYVPMLNSIPEMENRVDPTVRLLGIALDEDALANIFRGDLMLNVSDFREVESTYIDYVYDEEYNKKKVEKTKKEMQPIITGMASIGNQKHFNEIVKALKAYGVIAEDKKNQFKLAIPGAKINPTFVVKDGLLIATNDNKLIEMLADGDDLRRRDRLSKDMQSQILENSQLFFIDLQRLMGKLLEDEKTPPEVRQNTEVLNEYFKHAKLTGIDTENNYFEYDFRLSMKDEDTNAAMQLFMLANEFFLLKGQGK